MWYKKSANKSEQDQRKESPDYRLVLPLIQNLIKNRLYLLGNFNPDPKTIRQITTKVMNKLETKYGSIDMIRSKTTDQELTPMVKAIVDSYMQ